MPSFISCSAGIAIVFLFFNNAVNATMPFDKGFSYCFSLPRNAVENGQEDCKRRVFEDSNNALKKEEKKLKAYIYQNYDNPWLLDDTEGTGIEIKDVFWQRFSLSQKKWQESRDELCSAEASLPGSWASAAGDIRISCIITMNQRRIDEINMLYHPELDNR
ncbi:DUF1311 domain-containing protein [Pantoea alhagi]|uniref:lysozyme inhibitor LprI family protein n=1 Tax=Pantoea alhagi TaxID=1891675 RepID=UPI00202AC377|nr:lysozyme inhibitor LprI family protein [Pantoea alhagi]URQ60926.1 DUF1311 domain-containing protein [Pantoea alhagi]